MFNFLMTIQSMNMNDAVDEMKKNPGIQCIDVRTLEEYEEGHLFNSRNLPLSMIERATHYLNHEAPIYVYCASGIRSKKACRWLIKNGYNDVVNLGGIMNYHGEISKPFQ